MKQLETIKMDDLIQSLEDLHLGQINDCKIYYFFTIPMIYSGNVREDYIREILHPQFPSSVRGLFHLSKVYPIHNVEFEYFDGGSSIHFDSEWFQGDQWLKWDASICPRSDHTYLVLPEKIWKEMQSTWNEEEALKILDTHLFNQNFEL